MAINRLYDYYKRLLSHSTLDSIFAYCDCIAHPVALDSVICVIDAMNFTSYSDTSSTARMQAKYNDLIVLNKWELAEKTPGKDVEKVRIRQSSEPIS